MDEGKQNQSLIRLETREDIGGAFQEDGKYTQVKRNKRQNLIGIRCTKEP